MVVSALFVAALAVVTTVLLVVVATVSIMPTSPGVSQLPVTTALVVLGEEA